MAFDFLRLGDCAFYGPALPEPYVRFELEKALAKHKLLPDADGLAGQALRDDWDIFRRKLRDVSPNSGPLAITNRILEPLVSRLGYAKLAPADTVLTREGDEAGGVLMTTDAGAKLRCWAIDYDADLDAPTQRGYAYRFSPVRIAQRVLLATGERVGLITNGVELRLLLCDPARPESHVEIDLNVWRLSRDLPDGYQLLLALAGPAGIAALPEIIEDARLKQNKVTKELRNQAREAIKEFVQAVLDHPDNAGALAGHADKVALAKALWHEGLIVVYRLLFILKCESTSDPSRVFRFASTPLWRNTYSPSTALARTVRLVLDEGATSGRYLEDGLRVLCKLFAEGLEHPGLTVRPLGGALFGAQSTPLLSSLRWGELAVAHLLNRLLWSDTRRGRERVHYGPLDVEDLGRVYEALLELEPGIATEPMCRLRRQKLEVVVPAAQGEKYRATAPAPQANDDADNGDEDQADDEEAADDDKPARGKKTKVEWIEAIAPGRFYLRVGLGRKSSGSYYTPHSFVRFLVQETLGPQCDQRSPRDNPDPGAILKLKVLDPACGSGHFLVEACRFLAGRVYEAARLCDELATKAEHDAEAEKNAARKQGLLDRAAELRQRLRDLPDQEDELLSYLPSRSAGADKAVLSAHDIARAEAICRRLVAVHCIYGVDINPLAVELAKLSLWIESHAEGFPLTFLDHRIVVGNSLTGPFWEKLMFAPGSQQPVSDLFRQNLDLKLAARLREALTLVRQLEASVGVDVEDIAAKEKLKREIDARLHPFRMLAAAWSGGVMLGTDQPKGASRCDDAVYSDLLDHVGNTGELPASIDSPNLQAMIDKGRLALSYDLTFPEVFHPTGLPHGRHGFDAVNGNPPWDKFRLEIRETLASFDPELLVGKEHARTQTDAWIVDAALEKYPEIGELQADVQHAKKAMTVVLPASTNPFTIAGSDPDLYQAFMARSSELVCPTGIVGFVVGAGLVKNPADSKIRAALSREGGWKWALHFINLRRLFADLPPVIEYALVGWSKVCGSEALLALDLTTANVLTRDDEARITKYAGQELTDIVARTGYFPVPGARSNSAADAFDDLHNLLTRSGIELVADLHRTGGENLLIELNAHLENADDAREPETAAVLNKAGVLVVYSGKSIAQFDDLPNKKSGKWMPQVKMTVDCRNDDCAHLRSRVRYYRLAIRATCGSPKTNQRSLIACLISPGRTATHSILLECAPQSRANAIAMLAVGTLNSFSADHLIRPRIIANISLSLLKQTPAPRYEPTAFRFVAHGSLRLSCSGRHFEPLWREQLGDAWREPGKVSFTWPVLVGDDERWAVRAAIDAVVADAYGLSREQYAHVLSTFSHASYKKAPELCLAAFDELKAIGLDAFCKKHDPYHDTPLVETLPKPVIDLPIPVDGEGSGEGGSAKSQRRKNRVAANQSSLWNDRDDPHSDGQPPTAQSPAPPLPTGTEFGRIQAVKTLLEVRKVLTSTEVQKEFGIELSAVRSIFKYLVENDLATMEGKGRGTRYRWRDR